MTTIDEIRRMQEEGKTEQEMIESLEQRGIPEEEIISSLEEAKIKAAVSFTPTPGNEDMVPSIMTQQTEETQTTEELPSIEQGYQEQQPEEQYQQGYDQQQYAPEQYPQEQYQQDYSQYPVYQPSGLSPDTITEIAEQAIEEKLEDTRAKLQDIASFKASMEATIDSIDSRLQRIEKVIDRLQLSVLQKVGDYVNNVDDIKRELIETQKSFKSLLPQARAEQKSIAKKSK